jgi:hypothetical protein
VSNRWLEQISSVYGPVKNGKAQSLEILYLNVNVVSVFLKKTFTLSNAFSIMTWCTHIHMRIRNKAELQVSQNNIVTPSNFYSIFIKKF